MWCSAKGEPPPFPLSLLIPPAPVDGGCPCSGIQCVFFAPFASHGSARSPPFVGDKRTKITFRFESEEHYCVLYCTVRSWR